MLLKEQHPKKNSKKSPEDEEVQKIEFLCGVATKYLSDRSSGLHLLSHQMNVDMMSGDGSIPPGSRTLEM